MPEGTGDFAIIRWQAWSPGVSGDEGWQAWLTGGSTGAGAAQLDVSALPALLRRRLDRLGRMALHVAWQCAADEPALSSVFASRHGSLRRTLELLDELAREEPLSPAGFSLSVHNSAAGLFSIARADRSPATALAAGQDSLTAALLEALGMLEEGKPRVLLVYADEPPPPPYAATLESGEPDMAVALLLGPAESGLAHYRLRSGTLRPTPERAEVALMRLLLEDVPATLLPLGSSAWQLERVQGHA